MRRIVQYGAFVVFFDLNCFSENIHASLILTINFNDLISMKKLLCKISVCALLIFTNLSGNASFSPSNINLDWFNPDNSDNKLADWMSFLPDDAFVSDLSIPGTHDSATGEGFSTSILASSAQTQEISLADQREKFGIRAYDIRPAVSSGSDDINNLYCYHGIAKINKSIDSFFSELCAFLDNHPKEFFIIHLYPANLDLKTDANKAKIKARTSELMLQLITDKYKSYVCDFKANLRVRDLRGKILFLKRSDFDNNMGCATLYEWNGDVWSGQNSKIENSHSDWEAQWLYVQDLANSKDNRETKDNGVKILLEQAATHAAWYKTDSNRDKNEKAWVMNFASAYTGSSSTASGYAENASYTNKIIVDYLSDHTGPTGIIMADWVGVETAKNYTTQGKKLPEAIIKNNFKYIYDYVAPYRMISKNLDGLVSTKLHHGNVEWVDLDGDGIMDLTVKGRDYGDNFNAKLHLLSGAAGLTETSALPSVDGAEWERLLIPGDYNADSSIDMIYGCSWGSKLLHNDGTGNLSNNDSFTLYGQEIEMDYDNASEKRASGLMHLVDLNMDGYADILTYSRADNADNAVPLIFSNYSGTGSFYGQDTNLPALRQGTMAIGDYNHDGRPDVLVSGLNAENKMQVCICLNKGDFTFDLIYPESVQPYATKYGCVGMFDANGDQQLDLFLSGILENGERSTVLLFNKGDNTFENSGLDMPAVCYSGMDWCDIDGDGLTDIIYAGEFAGDDTGYGKTVILHNQGDGKFQVSHNKLQGVRGGATVKAYDYNNCGYATIAVMGYSDGGVSVKGYSNKNDCLRIYEPADVYGTLAETEAVEINDPMIIDNSDGTITITWQPIGSISTQYYNYIVETKDGKRFSAIPVDHSTGKLRLGNIEAATTGTSVTLNIPYSNIKSYGVQAIGADKKAGAYPSLLDPSVMTGVSEMNVDTDVKIEYFNLQGQRIDNPSNGVYIKREGSKVTKCIIH